MQKCVVDECQNKPRSKSAELCPKHYHRMYRHGSLERNGRLEANPYKQQRSYRRVYRPGHPLAGKYGAAYEHRIVLYEAIGPGTHPCHWCKRPVTWATTRTVDSLAVDHLNGVEHDNRLENLVPSCNGCNTGRAQQAHSLYLRSLGYWSGNDTIASLKNQRRRDTVDPEYRAAQVAS